MLLEPCYRKHILFTNTLLANLRCWFFQFVLNHCYITCISVLLIYKKWRHSEHLMGYFIIIKSFYQKNSLFQQLFKCELYLCCCPNIFMFVHFPITVFVLHYLCFAQNFVFFLMCVHKFALLSGFGFQLRKSDVIKQV